MSNARTGRTVSLEGFLDSLGICCKIWFSDVILIGDRAKMKEGSSKQYCAKGNGKELFTKMHRVL